ncbi:DUF1588 domain-containing protein [Verrucomicrobia bacterium]|nr:DUF1588 domain-containing protein [Verrucomicrobiota bacterium]
MRRLTTFLGAYTLLALSVSPSSAEEQPSFKNLAGPFLESYCLDCHDRDTQKGDVSLQDLKGVDTNNADLWRTIWEQVALKEMPPRKKKNQPEAMDRVRLSGWITSELERATKDIGGFQMHHHPTKGNHLDHDLLFGEIPKGLEPPSTPARIWRIHPQEHLVRLNELIDHEPEYDPENPGLRTHGDHIPWNQEGELKIYYGINRLIGWVGGTAAYAAAITGFPAVMNVVSDHGIRNYPGLYSVNGAEATQIARHAEDILHFMAFGPKAEPFQFGETKNDIKLDEKYVGRDIRGLAQSLYYKNKPARPLTPVYDLMNKPGVSDEQLKTTVEFLFEALTFRPPSKKESKAYLKLAKETITDLGKKDGAILGLVPIFLDRDSLFRPELATKGKPDRHGRVMLQDQELLLAINSAFSYIAPDKTLKEAVAQRTLITRDDVRREVTRILADDSIRKPRILQFFREYFDYDRAGRICKDSTALKNAGGEEKRYYRTMFAMTASTDRLVELILKEDKNVLTELLTTDQVVIDAQEDTRYFSDYDKLNKNPPKADRKKKYKPSFEELGFIALPKGDRIHVRIEESAARFGGGLGGNSARNLTTLPDTQRRGILTHPSWLVSHSDAMDNHAILRGRWIRERLLGDAVPDVPITVDAMLPDEPKETLRHRMRVTSENECWRCHKKMDPLGLPFEMFNHIGLNRTTEQGKPVDTRGEIINSGDPALDGPVEDALDMISKLAKSDRVEQVFVRHAFRYWMGRNETINDAPVLQDAYKAYHDNSGSMKAMLTSLLTSDAFLYRKVDRNAETASK